MSQINISESQIQFAYLHAFLNVNGLVKYTIPSIRQEGGNVKSSLPAGADIILKDNYLIQFKRPFYFKTDGIKEFQHFTKPKDINKPYFRFYIKNSDDTNQLTNLVKATKKGFKADYISPTINNEIDFHKLQNSPRKFLDSFAHINIDQFEHWLRVIGHTDSHTVLYTQDSVSDGFCYCFSESKKLGSRVYSETSNDKQYDLTAAEAILILNNLFENRSKDFFLTNENNNIETNIGIVQNRLLSQYGLFWIFNS